jgi:hypothetical protein
MIGSLIRDTHRVARGRRDAKGVARQWLEMAALMAVTQNGPGYYQMAGLWRRDRPFAELFDHWSERRYIAELARINPMEYRKISQHKVAEKALLSLLGLPTPRFIGLLDPVIGRDAGGRPLRDAADLARAFADDPAARACLKVLEGTSGKGFIAIEVIRDGLGGPRFRRVPDGREQDAAAFLADLAIERDGPRLIEAYLEQDPVFGGINPSSVNTLRLWVLRDGPRITTRLGYLRIGRQGAVVDNHGAGGIIAPVDLATGRLGLAHDALPTRTTFRTHPDHGAAIEGVVLPRIEDAMRLAEQALGSFPAMNFAGMDIAMAADGPQVIELNVSPGRLAPAIVGSSHAVAFGRRAPRR